MKKTILVELDPALHTHEKLGFTVGRVCAILVSGTDDTVMMKEIREVLDPYIKDLVARLPHKTAH